MNNETDSVLEALNNWYSRKIEKYYTPDVESRLNTLCRNYLFEKGGPELLSLAEENCFFNHLKRSYQLRRARHHFTHLNNVLYSFYSDDNSDEKLAESDIFYKFIDQVRIAELENIVLNDEMIDIICVDYFGSLENYTLFCQSFLDSVISLCEECSLSNIISKRSAELNMHGLEVKKRLLPHLNEVLFSSLKKQYG